MPQWALITIAVTATLLALAGGVVGALYAWRAYSRRALLTLVGRAEAIEASTRALVDVVTRLAHAEDDALAEFAQDTESAERRALHEVAMRTHLLVGELDLMPLPRRLVPVAQALADAALVASREAARVQDAFVGAAALDALAQIELDAVLAYLKAGRDSLNDACEQGGLSDMAVYGGGLYL